MRRSLIVCLIVVGFLLIGSAPASAVEPQRAGRESWGWAERAWEWVLERVGSAAGGGPPQPAAPAPPPTTSPPEPPSEPESDGGGSADPDG